jgi:hypothetical protein
MRKTMVRLLVPLLLALALLANPVGHGQPPALADELNAVEDHKIGDYPGGSAYDLCLTTYVHRSGNQWRVVGHFFTATNCFTINSGQVSSNFATTSRNAVQDLDYTSGAGPWFWYQADPADPDGVLDWTTASTWRGYDSNDALAASFWNVSGRIVSTQALVSGEPDDVCGGEYFVGGSQTFNASYSSACDWVAEG